MFDPTLYPHPWDSPAASRCNALALSTSQSRLPTHVAVAPLPHFCHGYASRDLPEHRVCAKLAGFRPGTVHDGTGICVKPCARTIVRMPINQDQAARQKATHRRMKKFLDTAVARSVHIPYDQVPHEPDAFLSGNSRLKIAKKYVHKHLLLKTKGQLRLERQHLDPAQNILWIYTGKRNFGDATMDLSGRALLRGRVPRIDLLTLPHLHPLFAEDDVFRHVFQDISEVSKDRYDAILMSEYNLPSIRLKLAHFADTPYACLFQYFYGPDRNQTCFSYAAVNEVFSLGHTPDRIASIAKPYLAAGMRTRSSAQALLPAGRFLAIAVGGMDANRTYPHWPQVLRLLDRSSAEEVPATVVLLGSDNGTAMAEEILRTVYETLEVRSYVGMLSLLQSREIVANASLFIGCDGGLMHVAHSTPTPSVSLFSNKEPPYLRLTAQCRSVGIQSTGDVKDIAPDAVAAAIAVQLRANTN